MKQSSNSRMGTEVRKNVYHVNGKIQIYQNILLGEGRNSKVFVGKYETKATAVKITSTKRREHLLHECNYLLNCTNDNILRFYGFEELNNKLYVALERCQGTLEDLVKGRYRGKSVGSTKQILSQIANGLEYLHENSIVHCDIRPTSILISTPLTNSADTPRIKIAGFGQSFQKRLPTNEEETIEPVETNNFAIFSWLEPECLQDPKNYTFDFDSDVFSFGLVCGYVATGGAHPFGKTDKERERNLKTKNYNPAVFATLDPCLVDLIERAIVIQRTRRSPNLKNVLELHPYFWTDKKALDYIVTNYNEKITDKRNPAIMNSLEDIDDGLKDNVLNGNWRDYLAINHPKIDALTHNHFYDGTKIFHLLRFIRNKSEHYDEMDEDLKQDFGHKPETEADSEDQNYFRFWAENFPHLLIHTWRILEDKQKACVVEYLEIAGQNQPDYFI